MFGNEFTGGLPEAIGNLSELGKSLRKYCASLRLKESNIEALQCMFVFIKTF